MKKGYPYLSDPRALAEIRKHKWLESQKQGIEVGFATAALDWIKKYGPEWLKVHNIDNVSAEAFIEKRKYRRYDLDRMVDLFRDNAVILANSINVSFFGLLCRTREYIAPGSPVTVHIPFERYERKNLLCNAIIDRVMLTAGQNHELFLRFDESSQEVVADWEYFRNR